MIWFKAPRLSGSLFVAVALFGMGGHGWAQPARVPSGSVIEGPGGPITSISFSPSGRLLLAREDYSFLRIWDVESRTQRHLIGHEKVGNRMKLWDDVPGAGRHLIREEDVTPRKVPPEYRQLRGREKSTHYGPTESMEISSGFLSDDRHILLQVNDSIRTSVCPDTVVAYDLETHGLETICTTVDDDSGPRYIGECQWSRRGNLMAFAGLYLKPSPHSDILVYDREKREVVTRIVSDDFGLKGYDISNSGETIAAQGYSKSTKGLPAGYLGVWNTRTGKRLGRTPTEEMPFGPAIFSPHDKDMAAVCGRAGERIVIWYLNTFQIKHTIKSPRTIPFGTLRYTTDGNYLVCSRADGTLIFWETRDYHEVLQVKLMATGAPTFEISPDGKRLCALSDSQFEQRLIRIYDMDQFLSLIPKGPAKEKP